MSRAEIDVLAERQRQIHAEGFDEAHDERNADGELADAAACYAMDPEFRSYVDASGNTILDLIWPWDAKWWKPKDRRRNLVRAAALIIAEIDRMDREEGSTP